MRGKKRKFELYSFFDQTGIEAHLRRMAARGWLLEKFGSWSWVYRRVEPRKLTFSVTYCPGASIFDPEPSEEQRTFYAFCAHTGWKLAASSAQMQVFYNERENPVPIETDPVVMVDTIHRSKGGFLFSNLALLLLALLQGWLLWGQLKNYPAEALSNGSNLLSGFCWLWVVGLCASDVAGYYLWHRRAAMAAERGEFLPRRSNHVLQCAAMAGVFAALVLYTADLFRTRPPVERAAMLVNTAGYFAMLVLVCLVRDLLKRRGAPKNVNRGVTLFLCLVLSLGLNSASTAAILLASQRGWLAEERAETYEYKELLFTAYNDELPLTVEDLLGVEYDGYSRRLESRESFLTGWQEAVQKSRLDAADSQEMPYLSYRVATVKVPALYDLCRDAMLRERDEVNYDKGVPVGYREQYQAIDPGPWQAAEAYQLVRENDGPQGRYLLCYAERIVEIRFDWEVTAAQREAVAERLGG